MPIGALRVLRVTDSAFTGELWPRGVRFAWGRDDRRVVVGSPRFPEQWGRDLPVQGYTGYVAGQLRGRTADLAPTAWTTGWLWSQTLATVTARGAR